MPYGESYDSISYLCIRVQLGFSLVGMNDLKNPSPALSGEVAVY
jgi:hypothetical protein